MPVETVMGWIAHVAGFSVFFSVGLLAALVARSWRWDGRPGRRR